MRIKLILKNKKDGKIQDIYPPVSNPQNGLIEWPVDNDEWEVLSVHGCSGIKLENFFGSEWLVYEGDQIWIRHITFRVEFRDGMFGIEVKKKFFTETLMDEAFASPLIEGFYNNRFVKEKEVFVPLAHLNINGMVNGERIITLK